MNRPGQHTQRPLNMNPNLAAGAYRNQYPSYAVPPRTVLPGGGGAAFLQQQQANHRTPAQNMIHQPSPGFMQQRGSSTYAFNSGLGQPQPSLQSHANPQQQQLHQQQQQQQQQQQTNGTVNSLPPHLSQRSITPGLAPSVSSNSEAGLDPNDFPALGSSTAPNNNANAAANAANSAVSYASQAGAASIAPINTSSGNAGSQGRDLTADDFPALGGGGGGGQQGLPTSQQAQDTSQQPPGLNGFHQNDQQQPQQQRQNVLSALGSGMVQQSGTPGMLNLGAARAAYQLGQTEVEKRNNFTSKLNQATNQAAWNSSNVNPVNNTQPLNNPPMTPATQQPPQTNGTHPPSQTPAPSQNGPPPSASAALGAPPGVPVPSGTNFPHSQQQPPYTNGNGETHPQTAAQQILVSAADRWGLLSLVAMIKNSGNDLDGGLSSVGTDLGTMGLDMGYGGNLYSTFITPWADQSAAHSVEPDFRIPSCYPQNAAPPGPAKAQAFSDETLFMMFYANPRDAMQEVAAQELWSRNWRFHKELRVWITKETNTTPATKHAGGESGVYTFWDVDNWCKDRKEMTVMYADLEEKNQPVFAPLPTIITVAQHQAIAQQQQQQGLQPQQVQAGPRGAFQM